MNKLTITGQAAEVKWAYHTAVSLASWSLTDDALTATVVSADHFRVSQKPLTFVVTRPSGVQWTWPIQCLQIAGQTLTASVAPQE